LKVFCPEAHSPKWDASCQEKTASGERKKGLEGKRKRKNRDGGKGCHHSNRPA